MLIAQREWSSHLAHDAAPADWPDPPAESVGSLPSLWGGICSSHIERASVRRRTGQHRTSFVGRDRVSYQAAPAPSTPPPRGAREASRVRPHSLWLRPFHAHINPATLPFISRRT